MMTNCQKQSVVGESYFYLAFASSNNFVRTSHSKSSARKPVLIPLPSSRVKFSTLELAKKLDGKKCLLTFFDSVRLLLLLFLLWLAFVCVSSPASEWHSLAIIFHNIVCNDDFRAGGSPNRVQVSLQRPFHPTTWPVYTVFINKETFSL